MIRVICRGQNIVGAKLSSDSHRIAFNDQASSVGGSDALWIANRPTGQKRDLLGQCLAWMRWSPDSKLLVGTHTIESSSLVRVPSHYDARGKPTTWRQLQQPSLRYVLLVVNAANGRQVASVECAEIDQAPCWFPDGRRVLFQDVTSQGGINLMSLTVSTGKTKTIPQQKGQELFGAFDICSKDGLVVGTFADGKIGTVRLSKSKVTELSHDGGGNRSAYWPRNSKPKWSPDGQRVAYRNELNAYQSELRVVTRDGVAMETIPSTGRVLSDFFWSPDNAALVWVGSPIPSGTSRKPDVVPGVQPRPDRPVAPGEYGGPYCLYVAAVAKPQPRCVLVAEGPIGIAGWDAKGVLVCYSQGAIFEVRP